MLRYMLEIWDHYGKVYQTKEKLPVVVPVLVTHAATGWKGRKLSDLIDLPSEAFRVFVPDFHYTLYDSHRENPESYDFNAQVKALLTIWRLSYSEEFMQELYNAFRIIKQIEPETDLMDFLVTVIQYLLAIREEKDHIDIKNIASREIKEGGKKMETIEEMLKREGRDEGVLIGAQQGKLENAREMLLDALVERFGPANQSLVEKIKNIQYVDTLKMLFRLCFRVDSLERFEEQVRKVTE